MQPVSIILKTWNALPHVRLCVRTLLRNTDGPFELIVIDNGSRPDTLDFLHRTLASEQTRGRIRLVENRENIGPGAANRQGVALAEHNLICLLDSDVLVSTGWLSRLVSEFEVHQATGSEKQGIGLKLLAPLMYHPTLPHPFDDEDSAAAWFRVKREEPSLPPLQQFYAYARGLSIDEFADLMCSTEEKPGFSGTPGFSTQVCPPDFIGTACALLDRGFVEAIGGIADPRFTGYGSEDVDLCWRIGEAGGMVARTAAVYAHHFHHASLADNAADPAEALALANQILYDKWRDKLLDLCRTRLATGGSLREYLSRHFIFGPLARCTTFLADLSTELAEVTGLAGPEKSIRPDEIVWHPMER